MKIILDDLTGPTIAELLQWHMERIALTTPRESIHALDLDGLRRPEITFWSVWDGEELVGCGALKELDPEWGEVKSMRTAASAMRRGVGSVMMQHLLTEAKRRGYRRLSLETGSQDYFEPARKLYEKFGFVICPPFADYWDDPNSVFMTREV